MLCGRGGVRCRDAGRVLAVRGGQGRHAVIHSRVHSVIPPATSALRARRQASVRMVTLGRWHAARNHALSEGRHHVSHRGHGVWHSGRLIGIHPALRRVDHAGRGLPVLDGRRPHSGQILTQRALWNGRRGRRRNRSRILHRYPDRLRRKMRLVEIHHRRMFFLHHVFGRLVQHLCRKHVELAFRNAACRVLRLSFPALC